MRDYPTKTMYAITHVNRQDLRVLTLANQGRNHCDTKEQAQEKLDLFRNSLRESVLGDMADTLEVRPVECYEHGDAIGIYFGFEIRNKKCFACKNKINNKGEGHDKDCPTL
jgi:hypothetical protein